MSEKNDKTRMIWVGSGKGGCGKSVSTMALLDHLIAQKVPVQLVETDTSNPDVAKAYKETVDTELINLDVEDGWIVLLNLCERVSLLDKVPGRTIVVSTGSGNNDAVQRFGSLLASSLESLQVELVTVWVIDGNRDCLELLLDHVKVFPKTRIYVLKNQHCARTFELYESGKTRELVEGGGGASLTLPNLSERVMQTVNRSRLTFSAALTSEQLQFGHKQVLLKWQREVGPLWAQVLA